MKWNPDPLTRTLFPIFRPPGDPAPTRTRTCACRRSTLPSTPTTPTTPTTRGPGRPSDGAADDTPLRPQAPVQDASAAAAETPVTARRALPQGEDFRRTVGFTVLGTVVPGLGLIAAGRRAVGWVVLAVFVLTVAALGIAAAVDHDALIAVGVDPTSLRRLSIVLVVVAALWVVVVVATHLALRRRPTRPQRVIGGVLVGVLAFAVAAPMAVAARSAYVSGRRGRHGVQERRPDQERHPALVRPQPVEPARASSSRPTRGPTSRG